MINYRRDLWPRKPITLVDSTIHKPADGLLYTIAIASIVVGKSAIIACTYEDIAQIETPQIG